MRPHGLKGLVTVSVDPDAAVQWSHLKVLFIEQKNSLVPFFIESASERHEKVLIKFEDIASVEEASALKNHSLFLPKQTRPKLTVGDFYDDEILGFQVVDESKGKLGTVEAIERAGINRFIIVSYKEKEVMIPVQPPLLKSINKSKKRVTVNLPDGFLDI